MVQIPLKRHSPTHQVLSLRIQHKGKLTSLSQQVGGTARLGFAVCTSPLAGEEAAAFS